MFEAACSSPGNAGRTMVLQLRGGYSTLNDTLVIAGLPPQGTIAVPVTTLDAILRDANAPRPLDFISIDVEGHEIEVFDGFDLDHWRPRLILVEDHVLDLESHRTLQRRGYKWVRRSGLNGWYVPSDSPDAGRMAGLAAIRAQILPRSANAARPRCRAQAARRHRRAAAVFGKSLVLTFAAA